jgi:predicted membrane channel-forming protein YqfA (hemolysin III family)
MLIEKIDYNYVRDEPDNKHKGPFIGPRSEVEEWAKWDELFERGFRVNFNTKLLAWQSIFWVHNETVNIWSHMLAIFYFAGVILYLINVTDATSPVPRWPLFT